MMLEKTRGIVLHTLKYSDSSLIVDVYTELLGTTSFMVRIPKSRKAALKSVFFQPLSLLELDCDFRLKVSLQKIKDVRVCYAYSSVPYHPYKSSMALFLAEFLYRALRQEVQNKPLFAYLFYSIQWLDRSLDHFSNFHLVFITRLTRFLGFYPNVEEYRSGDYFDMQNGRFCSCQPFHNAYLKPEEAARIPLIMRMNYDTMHLFVMNRIERNRYLEVLNDYYRLHVPDFPELKSLEILRQLFV